MTQQERQPASIRTLLETTEAWNGTKYTGYPQGQPKITLLHVVVPPNTRLDAHSHPVPSAGYMLRGALYLLLKIWTNIHSISRLFPASPYVLLLQMFIGATHKFLHSPQALIPM